jgi:hypothetical protein
MKKYVSVPMAWRFASALLFLLCISLFLHTVKAQDLVFAKGFSNGEPAGGFVENKDIAVDGAGNSYVIGYFSGTADFDSGPGSQVLTSNGGDIFLAKYDVSGNYVWVKRMGNNGYNEGYGVAVDASGNCIITGYFLGTIDFDPGPGTALLNAGSFQNSNIFLAKYDAAGNYIWAKNMGGTGSDKGNAVKVDALGNSYVTGQFTGTADLDPGTGTANLTAAAGNDIFLAKYDASGNYVWANRIGSENDDISWSLAVDASGNSYITGQFGNVVDFDPGAGTQNLTASGLDIFLAKYDASGNYVWAKGMGGTGNENGYAVAVDVSGNSYITGYFTGTADLDPGAGVQSLTSNGLSDIFLAKYDASGNYVWSKRMGGINNDEGAGLAVDATGNCYLTGTYRGPNPVDFDPAAGTQNLLTPSGTDIYLAKYDGAGNYVWAKGIGGTSIDNGYCITIDASGRIYSAGSFGETVDFDPGAGTAPLTAGTSNANGFVLQLNNAGNYVWAKAQGGYNNVSHYEQGTGIAVDASGNSYVTGYFAGTVDFDPGPGTQPLTSAGNYDIFLAKYDALGNYVWAKKMGSSLGNDIGSGLVLDASGNCYIAGHFYNTVDFDPGAGTQNLSAAGNSDIFLAKYDASGNYVWAKSMGSANNDMGYALAIDASGNSYITGSFIGTVDFDPGTGTQNLMAAGGSDIYLAKYDGAGNYIWAKSMGGSTDNDVAYGVAIDASGNSYITGSFMGTADFDPGAGTQNLIASGSTDIFLAKYNASGNYIWAKSINGAGNEVGYSVAVDGLGNSYISGNFSGTVDFDAGTGTSNLTAVGSSNDGFLAKYDATGNYVWARSFGSINNDLGQEVAIDASGNSYITGYIGGTIDFDPGTGTRYVSSAGGLDIFMAKYDASGNNLWAKSMGGESLDVGYALAVDGSGYIYITGNFIRTADFDPGAGTLNYTSLNSSDFFIAKYTAGITLPVQLESFTGELINNGAAALLQWTTAVQENHAYFEVERSSGGSDHTSLGHVTGCGTCSSRQQYSFKDLQPLTGKSYYRLKIVDKDGKTEYSKWINIHKNDGGGTLVMYPTITTGAVEAYYDLAGEARPIRISIFNTSGQRVQQRQAMLVNGNNPLRFDLKAQAPGIYYIQIAEQNGKVLATGTAIRQ